MDPISLIYRAMEPENASGLRLQFDTREERNRMRSALFNAIRRDVRKWGETDASVTIFCDGPTSLVIQRRDAIKFTVEPYAPKLADKVKHGSRKRDK